MIVKGISVEDCEVQILTEDAREKSKSVADWFKKTQSDLTARYIFYNLCFCLCAPQTTFDANTEVQDRIVERNYFEKPIPDEEMHEILKPVRFYRRKTKALQKMRDGFYEIRSKMIRHIPPKQKRDWLVENVWGMGMKAASHLLRNLGFGQNLAIVDTHVLKFLRIENWPSSKKAYGEVEQKLEEVVEVCGLDCMCQLDVIIWQHYSGTPWEDYSR